MTNNKNSDIPDLIIFDTDDFLPPESEEELAVSRRRNLERRRLLRQLKELEELIEHDNEGTSMPSA